MEKKGDKSMKIIKDNLFHSNFFLESGDVPILNTPPPHVLKCSGSDTPFFPLKW